MDRLQWDSTWFLIGSAIRVPAGAVRKGDLFSAFSFGSARHLKAALDGWPIERSNAPASGIRTNTSTDEGGGGLVSQLALLVRVLVLVQVQVQMQVLVLARVRLLVLVLVLLLVPV